MAQLLMPGSVVAMTDQAVDRLLKLDSGDVALLYLHLLRWGTPDGLRWPEDRKQRALDQLKEHGLAPAALSAAPAAPAVPAEAPPPEYGAEDITAALSDPASTFPALADEVERRLGKKLTANDLKILYTLYDHLALPTEVIFLLVNWCVEEMERKYGPGRKPFLSQIRREGFVWARKGIDTVEAAERYLQTLVRLRGRGAEVLRPDRRVGPGHPPAFLWATVGDATVPVENTLDYARALRARQVPFELHLFQDGPHAMGLADRESARDEAHYNAHAAAWHPLCIDWLKGRG